MEELSSSRLDCASVLAQDAVAHGLQRYACVGAGGPAEFGTQWPVRRGGRVRTYGVCGLICGHASGTMQHHPGSDSRRARDATDMHHARRGHGRGLEVRLGRVRLLGARSILHLSVQRETLSESRNIILDAVSPSPLPSRTETLCFATVLWRLPRPALHDRAPLYAGRRQPSTCMRPQVRRSSERRACGAKCHFGPGPRWCGGKPVWGAAVVRIRRHGARCGRCHSHRHRRRCSGRSADEEHCTSRVAAVARALDDGRECGCGVCDG
ncbi:hypothetical protein C8Q76DRAFT_112705 [Earliella scabrosa]|nr:hypothetical protein C8Q76DRAFT_112705 [Earliella scabrosa]